MKSPTKQLTIKILSAIQAGGSGSTDGNPSVQPIDFWTNIWGQGTGSGDSNPTGLGLDINYRFNLYEMFKFKIIIRP